MNRGKWRDLFEPQQIEVMDATMPRSTEWIAHGKEVYERRCLGCHGVTGDGNGPAATFMTKQRPRNFTAAVFKFRLTKEPLPTDGDLLRTITRGVRGTAMPAWYDLPLNDRLAVIQYIKYELAVDRSDPAAPYAFFTEEPPGAPLYIGKAARCFPGSRRSRQGSMADRQMLGVPWSRRKGRRPEGGRAEGRSRFRHRAGRPHQRPVQVGRGGRRHLPHHDDRAERHADALLSRRVSRRGPLGALLLRTFAVRL